MHNKITTPPGDRVKLIHARGVTCLFITINAVYLSLGIAENVLLEWSIVSTMILLQLTISVYFWNNATSLAKYSSLLWITHLCLTVFVLQPSNLDFHYYFIAIAPFLGYIDEFRHLFSRLLALISLVLYVLAIVWLTLGDILGGVRPALAVVEHLNQLLVGVGLIAAFLGYFHFKRVSLEQATTASLVDPLTRTFNRRALETDLQIVYQNKRGRGAHLVMMDLDDFKTVNDHYGHQAGDTVLVGIADIITCSVRSTDRLYRYGGEEFLLILRDIDESVAMLVAEKIRVNIELQSWEVLQGEYVTCSFGVAQLNRERAVEESIGRADNALYRAKSTGKNRVCV